MASFSHLLKGLFGNRSYGTVKRAPARRTGLAVEVLEGRDVPALFTVTTLSDAPNHSGVSLRDAVNQANANNGGDTIEFQPGLTGIVNFQQGQIDFTDSLTIHGLGVAEHDPRRRLPLPPLARRPAQGQFHRTHAGRPDLAQRPDDRRRRERR